MNADVARIIARDVHPLDVEILCSACDHVVTAKGIYTADDLARWLDEHAQIRGRKGWSIITTDSSTTPYMTVAHDHCNVDTLEGYHHSATILGALEQLVLQIGAS